VLLDHCYLAGLAAHVPPALPTARAAELGWYDMPAQAADGGWTGVAMAGTVAAPDLAVAAARVALARSGHGADDVDLVLHCSVYHQGPDGWSAPHYIQNAVLGGQAPAIELRQGCNGLFGALELAAAYLSTGKRAALITAADNFGAPLVDRFSYGWRGGRESILGDAGSALVLSRRGGFARVRAVASMSLPELEELYRGSEPLFPPDCTVGRKLDLSARIAHLGSGALASAAMKLARARREFARGFLDEAGVAPSDIARVTHVFAGDRRYVEQVLRPIGIDPERGVLGYSRGVGHLGASDHAAALDHLLGTRAVGPGDLVLMIGNAVGVSISCGLVEILHLPDGE
jgi:3-oxoacyl-[acyl-carrier-protein] synthase-3